MARASREGCLYGQPVFLYSIHKNARHSTLFTALPLRKAPFFRLTSNFTQAEVARFATILPRPRDKRLNALSFIGFPRIVSGFPLPTPVLTPGWAICLIRPKGVLHASL
jgi:hypothetical protein